MFLVMLRSMVDIATEFVVGGSRSVQAVPDIWNTFLLTRADQIYKKTIVLLSRKTARAQKHLFRHGALIDYRLPVFSAPYLERRA